jgi:predicted transcriptional regulator
VVAKTVRIDQTTSKALDRLSKETGRPKLALVREAVERLRRDRLLEAANAGFAALRADTAAWREEEQERVLWDTTLLDGLEKE